MAATEVILGAGRTNSREVLVIVGDEELHFALAPPAGAALPVVVLAATDPQQ